MSIFTAPVNIDLAWTPRFQPDDYLYGERFAFWNPMLGESAAPAEPRRADEPSNGELALRLFRTVAATEYALYGYTGRWKQPLGVNAAGEPAFPKLHAWGASVRTPCTRASSTRRRRGTTRATIGVATIRARRTRNCACCSATSRNWCAT
jgi:hypothetical protein